MLKFRLGCYIYKVVSFSSLVTNIRLSDLMPHVTNGSNDLLQEVNSEQVKTTPESKSLQPRSGGRARITDMKNANALG